MPIFGRRSNANLSTCHPDLRLIANEAIKEIDYTVIEGWRGQPGQHAAFLSGQSRIDWLPGEPPPGKHNKILSEAFDYIPCPFKGWEDKEGFKAVGEALKRAAAKFGIPARWGGDFPPGARLHDNDHFELE